jgi:hypothetical protein
MALNRILSAGGSAIVAFGVVAVAIIEAFGSQGDIGAGIVGVGVGALVAIAVFVGVALLASELDAGVRRVVDAVAVVGLTALVLAGTTYVNLTNFETTTALAIAAAAGGLAYVLDRTRTIER